MSRRTRHARRAAALLPALAGERSRLLDEAPLPLAVARADGEVVAANRSWRRAAWPKSPEFSEQLCASLRGARARSDCAPSSVSRQDSDVEALTIAPTPQGEFWLTVTAKPPNRLDASDPGEIEATASNSIVAGGRQARLTTVGQLAGGVAHDFNNLLSAIGLQVDELLMRRPVGDPDHENLAQIRATVARAASLANQLLAFASRATRRREIVDLGELFAELEVLLRRLLREDMRLEVYVEGDLPAILADPGQLETVFVNLVINARDAISSAGVRNGCVTIRTSRVDRARARCLGHSGAMGDMALVEIADNGPGIPADLLETIFDPFFTTKPRGQGTGLGLATVYGVVRQSDGWVGVTSVAGQGARFAILLPESQHPTRLEPALPPLAGSNRPRDLSGDGVILLVEDEDLVRGVSARLLRGRGYEVIEAADGETALRLASENAGRISLLISDVVMPGLDGPALLEAARPHLGAIPVLFISGYAESEFSELLEADRAVTFLAKPLDFKTLAECVKQALSGGAVV